MKSPNRPELSFLIESLHLGPNEFFEAFFKKSSYRPMGMLLNETVWELTRQKINMQDLREYNSEIVDSWNNYIKDKQWRSIGEKRQSIFEFVRKVGKECLALQSKDPYFKIENLNSWQNVTLKCGEDLFVAAIYADKRIVDGFTPKHFQWNYILDSDYFVLNNLIHQKKLVENHYHLGGSSPNVDLSWIRLMNYPFGQTRRYKELLKDGASYYISSQSYLPYHQTSLEVLVQIAACVRVWLFEKCVLEIVPEETARNLINQIKDIFDHNVFLRHYELMSRIDVYRYESYYSVFDSKIDYAIRGFLVDRKENNGYIAGERHLFYSCLYYIFSNPEDYFVQSLFYFYLLIRNHFNHVFIQTNNKTGFQNFKEYSDRKSSFISDTPYNKMAKNMAIEGCIKENHLEQLEARVMPYETPEEMRSFFKSTDGKAYLRPSSITFFDRIYPKGVHGDKPNKIDKGTDKFFYVLHFIKDKEMHWHEKEDNKYAPMCREYEKREVYKRKAQCFMEMRDRKDKICGRIYGIDAASNEVNFRPENFGTVFRYLSSSKVINKMPWECKIPDLHKTYHVGEDFYDVVDGLRAIDEAVLYLELSHGDRIGHGVALGVDVEKWYEHHPVVALPLQNKLDNLGWMLFKIREWNLELSTANYYNLYTEFEKLCQQLYKKDVPDLLTYIRAWKLRGDDPYCYFSPKYEKKWLHPVTQWERYSIRDRKAYERLESNHPIYDLYHKYHFDTAFKREAIKVEPFRCKPYYIDLVKQLQIYMRSFMLEKGVAVESCPTSNFLISNVDEFKDIPTFQLFPIRETHSDFVRLNVSINTDDKGVFYTSLAKEYSLLAGTLRKEMENGLRVHSDDKILNWVEHLINNSKQQCFREYKTNNESI